MIVILGATLAIVAAGIFVVLGIRSWVDDRSAAIRSLREANARFQDQVAPLPPIVRRYEYEATSKRDFDRVDLPRFTAERLLAEEALLEHDIRARHYRHGVHGQYEQEVLAHCAPLLGRTVDGRELIRSLHNYERKRFEALVLPAPVPSADIHVSARYVSPQGRNRYFKDRHLDYPQLLSDMNNARQVRDSRANTRELRQRERDLMSDRLRVDILRRDGGRCRLCGASAAQGATLHVDHIVPISHGGRTLASNLQVLCQSCNLGKGARFVG